MIYLDNNATTLVDTRVEEAMCAVKLANPSSPHRFGQRAKKQLVDAKQTILEKIAKGRELLFTSSATEAINMVIQGVEGHIITSSLEHAAVLESCKGKKVTFLDPLPGKGTITIEQIEEALRPDTALIVLMAANNETGVKTSLDEIAALGVPLLIDGVAILGKEEWEMPKGIVAAAFSAHKVHGPSGVGCLIYDKGFALKPLIHGGSQQRGLRAGTENVPGIVGFAKAVEIMDWEGIEALRDYFESQLEGVVIHGKDEPRIGNTSSVAFIGHDGEELLMQLDLAGIAVSFGSACSSASLQLSHVLRNMEVDPDLVRSTLRFSLSRFTTKAEIDILLGQLSRLLTTTDFTPSRLVSSAVNSN